MGKGVPGRGGWPRGRGGGGGGVNPQRLLLSPEGAIDVMVHACSSTGMLLHQLVLLLLLLLCGCCEAFITCPENCS